MKYKNYRNPQTNDGRIYSYTDLYNMPFGELLKHKQEILGQYRVLGVPTEKELKESENVVYVESYTREDGTEVKAHYRSKPNSGGAGVNNDENDIPADDSEVTEKKTEDKEQRAEEQTSDSVQEEKEIDKHLYPDEVAGVKRGEPMTKEDAGGKNVNPNYDSDDVGYKSNCSYCAAVYRARQMGFDIEALPVREDDSQAAKLLQKYPYYAYENLDGRNVTRPEKYRSNSPEECLKNIDSQIRNNEEYIMWYQPKEGTYGLAHVVNVSRNDKNELEFYDPQNGKTYGKEYIEKIDLKKVSKNEVVYYPQYLFRVDDKVVKRDVLKKFAKPSQRVSK